MTAPATTVENAKASITRRKAFKSLARAVDVNVPAYVWLRRAGPERSEIVSFGRLLRAAGADPDGAVLSGDDPKVSLTRSHPPFDHELLQFCDGFCRIETLRAGLGAVHDGVAAIEAERIF